MRIRMLFVAIAAWWVLLSPNAQAVGMVSRACNLDEVPFTLYTPMGAINLTTGLMFLGGPNYASIPPGDRLAWWALEALTVDWWPNGRYWLWAAAATYRGSRTANIIDYPFYLLFTSNWEAEASPSELAFVGGLVVRARAGTGPLPTIFHRLGFDPLFKVVGYHYYFDPSALMLVWVGVTHSSSCNLTLWGLNRELP